MNMNDDRGAKACDDDRHFRRSSELTISSQSRPARCASRSPDFRPVVGTQIHIRSLVLIVWCNLLPFLCYSGVYLKRPSRQKRLGESGRGCQVSKSRCSVQDCSTGEAQTRGTDVSHRLTFEATRRKTRENCKP